MGTARRIELGALIAASAAALFAGWWVFWFLCDDAFIAFRYVSNSQFGLGYVWNPPPFRPVEGYTSFLWVVLLDWTWTWTGVEPPESANTLSFGFSFGALAVIWAMGLRMRLSERLEPHRMPLLALAMFGILSNRTFLAWTSSGLETAMDTFLVLAWTYVAVFVRPGRAGAFGLALVAGILALCRPDGLLFCAITAAMVGWRVVRVGKGEALGFLPLVLPAAHLLWRHSFYGYWLPNTYYAKHVGAWPVAGAAYLASFALEYAYYAWIVVAVLWVRRVWPMGRDRAFWRDETRLFPTVGAVAVLLHFAYYTFNVGGDHFEYRVYHHLVPLVVLSFIWLAGRLDWSPRRTFTAFGLMIVVGLLVPWLHWWHTHDITVRKQKGMPHYTIAKHWPWPVRWYGQAWDGLQGFLIGHFIGLRHQSHKVYCMNYQMTKFPTREEGLKIDASDFPVTLQASVGVPGWVLPHVIVVDKLGLNDLVAAHTKAKKTGQLNRKMAHDRYAPKGYLECLRANLTVSEKGVLSIRPREKAMTTEELAGCETRWLAKVTNAGE